MADVMSAAEGIVTLPTRRAVGAALDQLEALLRARGVTIFARIDHRAGAASVGLEMPACEVLIFGSPRGGTPIMLAAPLAAIELPFKALAWADRDGRVWLSYQAPSYLAARFGLTSEQVQALAPLVALVEQAAEQAAS
jgi:uncharacterized protein (DUF302 family)